jgi:uncharacterized protein YjbJ (UPF0337 family)
LLTNALMERFDRASRLSKIDHTPDKGSIFKIETERFIRTRVILSSLKITGFTGRRPHMDQDRIKGSAQQAKGAVKEVVGKVTGDAKLESEGKGDKAAGKIQNAVGGLKDALRGK